VAYEELSAQELLEHLGSAGDVLVVDVREPDEAEAWAIPGSRNIPLGTLGAAVGELPRDRLIVTACASGRRSAAAAELLAGCGLEVANLRGGMAAWGAAYDVAEVAVPGATIVQVRRRGKGCLSYLVGAGEEAFVVDPSVDTARYEQLAADRGWRITRVLDTHLHADHVSKARELAARTGATLHLSPFEPYRFDYTPLVDGDDLTLPGGAELTVGVLHTPGHTEGSVVYRVGDRALLSGDTLFVDGVGRPDLAERAEEFARDLHRSLQRLLAGLDASTLVLPAHYGTQVAVVPGEPVAADLASLVASLEPLSLDEGAFVRWASARVNEPPPNYRRILAANTGRHSVDAAAVAVLEAGPNRCSA